MMTNPTDPKPPAARAFLMTHQQAPHVAEERNPPLERVQQAARVLRAAKRLRPGGKEALVRLEEMLAERGEPQQEAA